MVRLEVPVDLPEPTEVSIQIGTPNPESSDQAGPSSPKVLSVSVLPPLLLDISIPPAYPYASPHLRTVHATHSWLINASELRDQLAEKWVKGEGVLYTWVEWIRSGEFLDDLHMTEVENGRRIIR